jgi:aminoglycoside/choline kinase family phosphotransferase
VNERDVLRAGFLRDIGWHGAALTPITGDASFRRYFRLQRGSERAVLMDAPPPQENVRPYIVVARHLQGLGFSTPQIFAEDVERGFLLIEDFGDDTYTRVLERGGDETALYRLAVDVLIALHAVPAQRVLPPGVPLYETDAMIPRAMLLPEWYLPMVSGRQTPPDIAQQFAQLWTELLPRLDAGPRTLVLRDFHVDNLMLLPDRAGIAACGLLDFQDAGRGARAYDLVSLIEDARRDIAPALYREMMDRYLATVPADAHEEFRACCAIAAAQRHSRVIGVFARLAQRDGKPHYLRHLPRLWRLMDRALQHEALAPLKQWFDRNVPPALRSAA